MTEQRRRAASGTAPGPEDGDIVFVVDGGIDPTTGKRRQIRRAGFARRKDAQAAFDEIRRELHGGRRAHGRRSAITVKAFIEDEWLPAIGHTIEPSTFESYERNLRLHVTPRVGALKLRDLTASRPSLLRGTARQQ